MVSRFDEIEPLVNNSVKRNAIKYLLVRARSLRVAFVLGARGLYGVLGTIMSGAASPMQHVLVSALNSSVDCLPVFLTHALVCEGNDVYVDIATPDGVIGAIGPKMSAHVVLAIPPF